MTIYEFSDLLNVSLVVTRCPRQNNRFICSFDRAEIKGRGVLVGAYGTGKSFLSALRNYVKQIKGKTLVFDAYTPSRVEVVVPEDLSMS